MNVIPEKGAVWPRGNLMWGCFVGEGTLTERYSPCDGSLIQSANLLSSDELEALFAPAPPLKISLPEIEAFAKRLYGSLEQLRGPLRETMQYETGFIGRDCDEMLEGSLALVAQFTAQFAAAQSRPSAPIFYEVGSQKRRIELRSVSWGTVAIILPQNAFLLVGLTVALNALATGNRAILRAPLQSARSSLLLSQAFAQAQVPGDAVSVVLASSREFVTSLCKAPAPILLHYMGSSAHAPGILKQCFESGKSALADGAGNVWVYVDENIENAADILANGATRYNGQTCTSINGALIHPAIYETVRDSLREKLAALTVANPVEGDPIIGPLFDAKQAQWCAEQMAQSGGEILLGGSSDGNYLSPSLVEKPDYGSSLIVEGLFGPALWIAPGTREDFVKAWPQNQYPLCAGVLSNSDQDWWLTHLPNAARVVFNGDPSIEDIFEPWGGYPASGANPVSVWHEKYRRVVAVDDVTE